MSQTRSGLNYAALDRRVSEAISTGHSLEYSIQAALWMEDNDIVSPPGTPDSPLSPLPLSSSPLPPFSDAPTPPSPLLDGFDLPVAPNCIAPSLEDLADLVPLPPALDAQSTAGSSDWETTSGYATTDADYATDGDAGPAPPSPSLSVSQKRKRDRDAQRTASQKLRRQTKRQRLAEERAPTTPRTSTFHATPSIVHTKIHSESAPVNSTGFSARRTKSLKPLKIWTMKELRGMEVLEWDGM